MSETRLAGWAHTVTLCEGVCAVIAVRRGEFPRLRFPDDEQGAFALTPGVVDTLASSMRGVFGGGAAPTCRIEAGGRAPFSVARDAAEPLIALMRAAIKFSEDS